MHQYRTDTVSSIQKRILNPLNSRELPKVHEHPKTSTTVSNISHLLSSISKLGSLSTKGPLQLERVHWIFDGLS